MFAPTPHANTADVNEREQTLEPADVADALALARPDFDLPLRTSPSRLCHRSPICRWTDLTMA
jgi:hypothetical protein